MAYEIIETEKYLMRIHDDDFFEYIVKAGVALQASDVLEGKSAVSKRFPGRKFYILSEGIDFFTITPEARRLIATKEYSDNTLAVAFYSTNATILLLGEMYSKINKPYVPTKFFYNREAAKEWLFEQKRKHG